MNYLVVDLEATCCETGDQVSEIIEIGAVLVDSVWNILGEFDIFVRPIIRPILTDFCTNLTKISQQNVDTALTFPAALKELVTWIDLQRGKDSMIFCSWGNYDRKQFVQDCTYHSVNYPFSNIHVNLKNVMSKQLGKRPMGVARALTYLGLEFEGTHHRGIDDCRNIVRICRMIDMKIEV